MFFYISLIFALQADEMPCLKTCTIAKIANILSHQPAIISLYETLL